MYQSLSLLKIGSKVNIDLDLVKDRIPDDLVNLLKDDPIGTVLEYKMTDGNGIGVVVELRDKSQSWFFDSEIISSKSENLLDKKFTEQADLQKSYNILSSSQKQKKPKRIKAIKELVNPFNFIHWLIYSLKDVF